MGNIANGIVTDENTAASPCDITVLHAQQRLADVNDNLATI
jgi:hypothetical protein